MPDDRPASAPPRIGSACSGYGGLELGLLTSLGAGSVAWHVEYDKHPSAVLEARFPSVPNYGDVKTTDWAAVEPVDWFAAGYPCQPFSGAGNRLGEADERHLWPAIADAIRVLRPGNALLENVAGHLSLGFGQVLGDLAALGYDARWVCLRAADAGAPHNRARVFIVASDTRRERHGGGEDGRSLGRLDRPDAGASRQRQRTRSEPGDRSTAALTDACGGPLAGPAERGDGLRLPAERGHEPASDAASDGRVEGWTESARELGRPHAAEPGAATARDTSRDEGREHDGELHGVEWGTYGAAIRRWERVTGRPAPRPTELGRSGERLSPVFVEWMMGLPAGWVTDILPRNPALKALGNGCVPQQVALALSVLRHNAAVAA